MENLGTIHQIVKNLSYWRVYTEYSSSIYLNDVNQTNEDLVALLLNIVYGWNLGNLNNSKANYPAIDLGCNVARIGVSVTASNTSTYIHEKIETNIKHKVFETYPTHYFFITTKKKDYTTDFDTQGKFTFDKTRHIIDTFDLLEDIKKLPIEKQVDVLDVLERYATKFSSKFIEEITPQDISDLLTEFSSQNPTLTNSISDSITEIHRTAFPVKNEINNLSEGYIKLIQEHSLPFFKQFEDFLSRFENNALKNIYLNIVSDLQQVILINRSDFDKFDDIFMAIEETCKVKLPLLINDRRILKILLHFMYFQCDIGANNK